MLPQHIRYGFFLFFSFLFFSILLLANAYVCVCVHICHIFLEYKFYNYMDDNQAGI